MSDSTADRGASPSRLLAWAGLGVLVCAFLVWAGLTYVSPAYDSVYSLAWGQFIGGGSKPDVLHELAPLAHPLPIAFGAALSPLEPGTAFDVFTIVSAFALALLLFSTFRLTRVLVGPRGAATGAAAAAGALAAFLLITRVRIDFFALKATVDVPFSALVLLALSYVIESPRTRPWLPLALLVPAGLMRPESWSLGILYCAWLAYGGLRGRRLALCAALAAAPIAGWVAFAAVLTGDPLTPLTGNPDAERVDQFGFELPEALAEGRYWLSEVSDIVNAAVDNTRTLLGDEIAILGLLLLIGCLLPLVKRENRTPDRLRLAFAAALILLLEIQAMVLAQLGAPLVERYVFVPAIALLCLVCAAVWMVSRRGLAVGASVLLIALVTTGAISGGTPAWPILTKVREKLSLSREQRTEQEQLYVLTAKERVRRAVRPCNKVNTGGRGGIYAVLYAKPMVAHGLDRDPELVSAERAPRGKLTASNFRRDLPTGKPPFIEEGIWIFRSPCLQADYLERRGLEERFGKRRSDKAKEPK